MLCKFAHEPTVAIVPFARRAPLLVRQVTGERPPPCQALVPLCGVNLGTAAAANLLQMLKVNKQELYVSWPGAMIPECDSLTLATLSELYSTVWKL